MPAHITLVPNTSIQFLDIDLPLDRLPNKRWTFWEEPLRDSAAGQREQQVVLRQLVPDEQTGEMVDPLTGRQPPEDQVYGIARAQALEPFLEKWVPLPCLMLRREADAKDAFERGPSNWVRGRLCTLPGHEAMYRLTLAFDTTLLERDGGPFLAPATQHAAVRQEFGFPDDLDRLSWFLRESWVAMWLSELFDELLAARRPGRALPPRQRALEHVARYVVLLLLLSEANALPRVQLIDTVSPNVANKPVQVDLVLDIGHARTCGLLIEQHPGEGVNLADSYALKLRDLSRPEWLHEKPFDSRVEFARANFGRDAISRRSGRAIAFSWPSPLRVGNEAVRLSGLRRGNEGATGLTSPKRYLWDERPSQQSWRFADPPADEPNDPTIRGPFTPFIADDGTVLRGGRSGLHGMMRARFSRSSLFSFMLAEILLHAVCQINAPANREARRDKTAPRQLRRVLLTLPPGMPVFEQQILRKRAREGARLAWDLLGWTGGPPAPPEPRIITQLDEASATQIVWLHNEVAERFAGGAKALFARLGRVRPEIDPGNSLRVASLDIGGGTTDLMIVTYTLPGEESIRPFQEFRESIKIAGDDVLERVVAQAVVPCLERALAAAGVGAPRDVLIRSLSQNLSDQSEVDRQARRTFVGHVLEPTAIAVLNAYERSAGMTGEIFRRRLGDILPAELGAPDRLTRYIDAAAAAAGASGFRTQDVEVVADAETIAAAVRATLMHVLADLCEVAWHYDCDVLLLSGRPSRLPAVLDMIAAKSPVPPHRIVPMHRYRVGPRYPFRDVANCIDDPKTTAVVGAMLFVLSEAQIPNFALDPRQFHMRSTARVIGRMNNDGQILDANILLRNIDLDHKPAEADTFDMKFLTTTRIGFRQLDIERWTSTPLYMMEFRNPDTVSRLGALPLSVKVERRNDPDGDEADVERLTVVEVSDANGERLAEQDVVLRLQTLEREDGYWRDTGLIGIA
ncbi:MAG TPA: virulence factor SrfB [Acetobacteraceae bacterium]|nr:virulence factor SrfB [Acetobacteraceae bacterium]